MSKLNYITQKSHIPEGYKQCSELAKTNAERSFISNLVHKGGYPRNHKPLRLIRNPHACSRAPIYVHEATTRELMENRRTRRTKEEMKFKLPKTRAQKQTELLNYREPLVRNGNGNHSPSVIPMSPALSLEQIAQDVRTITQIFKKHFGETVAQPA